MNMYYPGIALSKEIIELFITALKNEEIKAELHKQIKIEVDSQRDRNSARFGGSTIQSYESLTSGNVNMQARMAVSGYDIYGNTIINSNRNLGNSNIYKKMKNRIKYGRSPQNGYINRGDMNIL